MDFITAAETKFSTVKSNNSNIAKNIRMQAELPITLGMIWEIIAINKYLYARLGFPTCRCQCLI